MPKPTKVGRKTENIARKKAISAAQAQAIADSQIWLRQFNPDYDQVMLRISTAVTGLHYGAPPGIVN